MELGGRAVTSGLMAAALLGGLILAGCDDDVEVLRDPDIRVTRGMTWAWRPVTPPAARGHRDADERPVLSRDVIVPARQHLESNHDWNNEANRQQVQGAIEKALRSRGLVQVTDPANADFLVDYHVAVKTRKATVGEVYPDWDWWGWGWGWGPPEVEYHTVRWHEGTFVFDLALRNPRTLAYRAISPRGLNNKFTISPYQAEDAVNHLLKGLKVQ